MELGNPVAGYIVGSKGLQQLAKGCKTRMRICMAITCRKEKMDTGSHRLLLADPGCWWVVQAGSSAGTENPAEQRGCSSTEVGKVTGKCAVGYMELPGEEKETVHKNKWDNNDDKQ